MFLRGHPQGVPAQTSPVSPHGHPHASLREHLPHVPMQPSPRHLYTDTPPVSPCEDVPSQNSTEMASLFLLLPLSHPHTLKLLKAFYFLDKERQCPPSPTDRAQAGRGAQKGSDPAEAGNAGMFSPLGGGLLPLPCPGFLWETLIRKLAPCSAKLSLLASTPTRLINPSVFPTHPSLLPPDTLRSHNPPPHSWVLASPATWEHR